MIPSYTYAALAFSAFTSATLLPGTSEAAFALFVRNFPKHAYGALLCAAALPTDWAVWFPIGWDVCCLPEKCRLKKH